MDLLQIYDMKKTSDACWVIHICKYFVKCCPITVVHILANSGNDIIHFNVFLDYQFKALS